MVVLSLFLWSSLFWNPVLAQRWQQTAKLTDWSAGTHFGDAVAMHQDLMVVGAYETEHGVVERAGGVFVYKLLNSGIWSEQAILTASNATAAATQESDLFGLSVAVYNETAAVGAFSDDNGGNNAGAVYIFKLDNAFAWTQQQKLVANDAAPFDYFGYKLAMQQNALVVTARGNDNQGGTDAGAAYVYEFQGSSWTETAKLVASDGSANARFGYGLALHGGDTLVVGAPRDNDIGFELGSVYVFQLESGVWTEQAKLTASDKSTAWDTWFGLSVDIDDNRIVVGAPLHDQEGTDSGAVYIFEQGSNGFWTEQAKLVWSNVRVNDLFGLGLALCNDTLFVGAPSNEINKTGAVLVYSLLEASGSWTEQAILTPNDENSTARNRFGAALAFQDEILVVGAAFDADNRGSAYIFEDFLATESPSAEPSSATPGSASPSEHPSSFPLAPSSSSWKAPVSPWWLEIALLLVGTANRS